MRNKFVEKRLDLLQHYSIGYFDRINNKKRIIIKESDMA
jgi:hypothetical protein